MIPAGEGAPWASTRCGTGPTARQWPELSTPNVDLMRWVVTPRMQITVRTTRSPARRWTPRPGPSLASRDSTQSGAVRTGQGTALVRNDVTASTARGSATVTTRRKSARTQGLCADSLSTAPT